MWKPSAKLENWAVVDSVIFQRYQELNPGKHLTGNVSADRNLHRAKFIYTSPIVSVDKSRGLVETRNTMYQLGEPSEEYKAWDDERRLSATA